MRPKASYRILFGKVFQHSTFDSRIIASLCRWYTGAGVVNARACVFDARAGVFDARAGVVDARAGVVLVDARAGVVHVHVDARAGVVDARDGVVDADTGGVASSSTPDRRAVRSSSCALTSPTRSITGGSGTPGGSRVASDSNVESQEPVEQAATTPEPAMVPQVRIGADGQIIINEARWYFYQVFLFVAVGGVEAFLASAVYG